MVNVGFGYTMRGVKVMNCCQGRDRVKVGQIVFGEKSPVHLSQKQGMNDGAGLG